MDKNKIEHNFTYHPPKSGDTEKFEDIREKAKELAILIDGSCQDCREKSLAVTKVEEAVFWANAGVAREADQLVDLPHNLKSKNRLENVCNFRKRLEKFGLSDDFDNIDLNDLINLIGLADLVQICRRIDYNFVFHGIERSNFPAKINSIKRKYKAWDTDYEYRGIFTPHWNAFKKFLDTNYYLKV